MNKEKIKQVIQLHIKSDIMRLRVFKQLLSDTREGVLNSDIPVLKFVEKLQVKDTIKQAVDYRVDNKFCDEETLLHPCSKCEYYNKCMTGWGVGTK